MISDQVFTVSNTLTILITNDNNTNTKYNLYVTLLFYLRISVGLAERG